MHSMRNRFFSSLALLVLCAGYAVPAYAYDLAAARDACIGALTSPSKPTDLRTLYSALKKVPSKDEFETGDAYRKRLEAVAATALGALGLNTTTPIVVAAYKPYLKYDAEKQVFRVGTNDRETTFSDLFGADGYDLDTYEFPEPFKSECDEEYTVKTCSGAVVRTSTTEAVGTPFAATNGFGVKVTVTPLTRRSFGVNPPFERKPEYRYPNSYPGTGLYSPAPSSFPMPADEAKIAAPTIRVMYCGLVTAPYVRDGKSVMTAKIDLPFEVTSYTYAVVTRTLAVSIQDTRPGGKRLLLAVVGDDGALVVQP